METKVTKKFLLDNLDEFRVELAKKIGVKPKDIGFDIDIKNIPFYQMENLKESGISFEPIEFGYKGVEYGSISNEKEDINIRLVGSQYNNILPQLGEDLKPEFTKDDHLADKGEDEYYEKGRVA